MPDYRFVRCTLHLHNPYNGLILLIVEDQKLESYLLNLPIVQSVSSITSLLNKGHNGRLRMPFSGEDSAMISRSTNGLSKQNSTKEVAKSPYE